MIPDGTVYDIACIQKDRMEELTGKYDIVNELGFLLEADYTYEDIRSVLSERLAPYGLISMSKKEDQTSYDMVEGEIGELISMGTILPFMFLSISVFMLYVVLKKMIDRDQSLIGTMKAFGMTDLELLVPYLMEGLIIGVAGALVGAVLAAPFGRYMFGMYVEFFNRPIPFTMILFGPESQESFWQRQLVRQRLSWGAGYINNCPSSGYASGGSEKCGKCADSRADRQTIKYRWENGIAISDQKSISWIFIGVSGMFPIFHGISSHVLSGGGGSDVYGSV